MVHLKHCTRAHVLTDRDFLGHGKQVRAGTVAAERMIEALGRTDGEQESPTYNTKNGASETTEWLAAQVYGVVNSRSVQRVFGVNSGWTLHVA